MAKQDSPPVGLRGASHQVIQAAVLSPGTNSGPSAGDLLLSLLRRFQLSRREQMIVVTVLTAAGPLTVKEIARRRRLAYPHAKAVVRTLVAWRILTRTPAGLLFQPDPALWGPPRDPPQP